MERYLRKIIRGVSNQALGTVQMARVLEDLDNIHTHSPRSLNGCDTLLIPRILKDFPDFDVSLAKTYVRQVLRERFSHQNGFTIHNVVISKYLRSGAQKTIVFQAAACHREGASLVQTRYDLHYTYLLSASSDSVAANCPNCGGALGYGVNVCPYCGSRVANVLGNSWSFTEILET